MKKLKDINNGTKILLFRILVSLSVALLVLIGGKFIVENCSLAHIGAFVLISPFVLALFSIGEFD